MTARFDNAERTPANEALFGNVDSLAATAALNPAVRKVVRDRARYVVSNCAYAGSMLDTFVTHTVGPWASVTFPLGGIAEELRKRVTDDFDAWAMATRFWRSVRTLLRAKITDGEGFALFVTDKAVVNADNRVSLNVRPIECDRVQSYTEQITRENEWDGIRFDENLHPVQYRVLRYHPGDYRLIRNIQAKAGEWVKAENVIHFFDALRPEQVRGVSDFVSALDIPALQKDYRRAVSETALSAASISGVLHTDIVPDCFEGENNDPIGKCAADIKPGTIYHIQRGSFVTIPEGWDLTQMKAEQPTTLYDSFVRSLVAEMAACLCMPVNIAMCDSSQHNFASAKLDHMTYGDKIESVRAALASEVLDRVFFRWLEEYAVLYGLDERTVRAMHKTEWLFKESRNSDVMKDASADNTRLMNGTATYESICGKRGIDARRFIETGLHERAFILAQWRRECDAQGLPTDTPCPFVTIKADGEVADGAERETETAPTEDMIEHGTQQQPRTASGRGRTRTSTRTRTKGTTN